MTVLVGLEVLNERSRAPLAGSHGLSQAGPRHECREVLEPQRIKRINTPPPPASMPAPTSGVALNAGVAGPTRGRGLGEMAAGSRCMSVEVDHDNALIKLVPIFLLLPACMLRGAEVPTAGAPGVDDGVASLDLDCVAQLCKRPMEV